MYDNVTNLSAFKADLKGRSTHTASRISHIFIVGIQCEPDRSAAAG